MARAASIGEDEVEGLDEEFLYHLSRGSDFLARGDTEAARISLDRALQLRAKDAKVLGLLGQCLYKMGRFEQAVEIYARLVDDNPVEAAARVNMGLACLKAKLLSEAVRQLTIALDLNPDHKRAMGYLGLALFESGEIEAARGWFVKAGKDQMVARCDEMIASGPRLPAPIPGAELPAVEPVQTSSTAISADDRHPPLVSRNLGAYASARLVSATGTEPFTLTGNTMVISVRGEMLARTDGLFAVQGGVSFVPEMKRFRGKATDQPFGEGSERMHRLSGQGVLFYSAEGRCFTSLELGAEAAYFREQVVFAFESEVFFENGRVPSDLGVDLSLVHLRAPGGFLLATRGEPMVIEVTPGVPLHTPLTALVGWNGVLTPRVLALTGSMTGVAEARSLEAATLVVELAGEGRVLLDPAVAGGASERERRR